MWKARWGKALFLRFILKSNKTYRVRAYVNGFLTKNELSRRFYAKFSSQNSSGYSPLIREIGVVYESI